MDTPNPSSRLAGLTLDSCSSQLKFQKCGFTFPDLGNLRVVTSTLVRTVQTAAAINSPDRRENPNLDEIDAGAFDGMTYGEIERLHPEDFEMRERDKLRYRYPQGKGSES